MLQIYYNIFYLQILFLNYLQTFLTAETQRFFPFAQGRLKKAETKL
jgi:hypothetical protein